MEYAQKMKAASASSSDSAATETRPPVLREGSSQSEADDRATQAALAKTSPTTPRSD